MTRRPDEAELHAYIDGRLPPERQADIAAWLRAHPDDATRIVGWKHDAEQLRAALAGQCNVPPNPALSPARLRRHAQQRRRARLAWAASVLLAIGLGGLTGWHARALHAPVAKPMSDAIAAYRLFAGDELALEFTAAERAPLEDWIARHFGANGAVPELAAQGWRLSGGRALSTPEGAAVMLVYEDAAGERVGVYMRPRIPHQSTAGERQDGELLAHYWLKDNIAYALIGAVEQNPLRRMAAALQTPGT